ncbi:uncharacterized protein SPSK_06678 [Sporothrix schenckii 1099-18]|uniref:Uncharacterized protein n=1 Tax=Sporothrix schenckii 1099-18 TaxID=1397361 RepID=A0A0F2MJQ8_SPOSC|nr:uncharacterized protein SPSK_06678 [Sporothrix schenckii 1099-18]KJR89060.1 hypothetical protein SPSK_06678 [Sporothrix schenckii 1099-18]
MKLCIVSFLILGLVAAAPAPVAAPAPYDRHLPARKGEPPTNLIRRNLGVDGAQPTGTATGTGTAPATPPLKTGWPTSANTAPKPQATGTGTASKAARIIPTGTRPLVLVTGTAGTIASAGPTQSAATSSYNFPSPTTTKVGKQAAEASSAFWWLQN